MSFETPRFRNLTPARCTVIPDTVEKKSRATFANGKHLVVDANAIFMERLATGYYRHTL